MPKRVHASAFNLELVEDRPKAVLDNFVCCIGSPVAIEEEKALVIRSPLRQIFFQHRDERFRHRYGSTTRLALQRLTTSRANSFPISRWTALARQHRASSVSW